MSVSHFASSVNFFSFRRLNELGSLFPSLVCIAILPFLLSATAVEAQNLQTSVTPIGQSSVHAGESLSYDFNVQNVGIFSANNVVLHITLPAGITHVANNGSCSVADPALISCSLGNLSAFTERTRHITLNVSDNFLGEAAGGFLSFSATASANGNPPANVVVGGTPVTELADLQVSNIATATQVLAGEQFEYTIFVDNFGPSSSRQVTLTDTLLGTENVTINSCAFSVSQGGGSITQFSCTTGQVVTGNFGATIGTMGTNFLRPLQLNDDSQPIGRLRARFILTALQDMTLFSDVRVFSQTPDPLMTNNQMFSEVVTVQGVADLSLSVGSTGEVQPNGSTVLPFNIISGDPFPDAAFNVSNIAVTAGRRVQYAYTVTNEGVSDAQSVTLTSQLPAGIVVVPGTLNVSYGDSSPAPGNCQFGTPGNPSDRMTCGLGEIESATTSGPITGFNARIVSFDVAVNLDLSTNTVLTNNVFVASNTVDTDNSDNLGASLMVVSPLIGVSACSVGGPYTNVICGNGATDLSLNGFGFALPDTGSVDFLWSTTCPNASFDDATNPAPVMSFTTANLDNTPVSCEVDLSVQNSFASSSCNGTVNVVDCAADCNGLLDGTAALDRCGVCEGDGNSCLGCTDQDVSDNVFTISTQALAIRRSTLLSSRQMTNDKTRRVTQRQAKRTFRENLAALSKIPAQIRTCTNDSFCVQTSNVDLFDATNSGLEQALSGLEKAVRQVRAQTGKRSAARRLLNRGRAAFSGAQAALVQVPLVSSSCS